MKVVILAGGLGTRISEESHLKPKPMIEIGGRPILWHIMKYYSEFGFHEFVLCLGYKQYVVKEFFADYFLHTSDVTFDLANNRMEVRAVIEGLQKLKYPCAVDVYSDSAYTVNAFANRWIYGWKKNGWKKADGKAVLNVDLWERLYELTRVHEVTFHKVAGHADDDLNNRCDELARQAISSLRDSLPEQAEEGESAEVSGSETN